MISIRIPFLKLALQVNMLCSLLFQDAEIQLRDEKVTVVKQSKSQDVSYKVHTMGIYLVLEAKGLTLIWDRRTGLKIKLSSTYKVGQ